MKREIKKCLHDLHNLKERVLVEVDRHTDAEIEWYLLQIENARTALVNLLENGGK